MQDELVVLYEAARQAQSLVQAMQQAIAATLLPPDPAISLHQAGLPALSSQVVQQLLELDLPLLPLQGWGDDAGQPAVGAESAQQPDGALQEPGEGGAGAAGQQGSTPQVTEGREQPAAVGSQQSLEAPFISSLPDLAAAA
ncbi:hypothetical protein HaLaN_22316, partial [Haematococcus lacustris]